MAVNYIAAIKKKHYLPAVSRSSASFTVDSDCESSADVASSSKNT
jgi:hypothetical protein